MRIVRGVITGAAAGAAGTTALNAATYLDMAGRRRASSSAPDDTVEKLADKTEVTIPGEGETHENQVSGLGALTGILSGVGVGAGLGCSRAFGWRTPVLSGGVLAGMGAMALTDGTMTALGVSDPRTRVRHRVPAVGWPTILRVRASGLLTTSHSSDLDSLEVGQGENGGRRGRSRSVR